MCKFLWERDQNKVSQRAAWKERILSPHFKGGSEAQRKQTIIQTCRRKTVTGQTRFQAPNPQMAELSLGVSPCPLGGPCWVSSCLLAIDTTLCWVRLTFRCQKFEGTWTSNVLACNFCTFSPRLSALLIPYCHTHLQNLLKPALSEHSLVDRSVFNICVSSTDRKPPT